MTSTVYANSFVQEDTVDGTVTVTFPWKSRRIIVTNDSGIDNLSVSPRAGSLVNHTLGPGESLTLDFRSNAVELTSTEPIGYRVWAFG